MMSSLLSRGTIVVKFVFNVHLLHLVFSLQDICLGVSVTAHYRSFSFCVKHTRWLPLLPDDLTIFASMDNSIMFIYSVNAAV